MKESQKIERFSKKSRVFLGHLVNILSLNGHFCEVSFTRFVFTEEE